MFTAALLMIVKRWKQPTHPSPWEEIFNCGVDTQWEYYSAMKEEWNPDMRQLWINRNNVKLREISQTQKGINIL